VARLLVVHHSPTEVVRSLTEAVVADDVLGADGFLFGTTANFGYMSGALKHFFDTIFLEAGGALSDDGSASGAVGGKKPYGLWVHGRYDTTGAVRSVRAIVGALPWTQAAEVLEVLGDVGVAEREAAYELGGTLAALLDG
jgi:multimeric flavodoxin WrbA